MKKPIIGLTPSHDQDTQDISMRPTYLKAIEWAGGIPIVFPLKPSPESLSQLCELVDGVLFTGGPDPHPFLFGEETHEHCGHISMERDKLELELFEQIKNTSKPILGICRGAQILNIAMGGSIYQDLFSQHHSEFPIAHRQPVYFTHPSHHVAVTPGSLLSDLSGGLETIAVNSSHHQAIRDVAPGLLCAGIAPDGIIEEVEKPEHPFFLGVQWHPEYRFETDETSRQIFLRFIDACKKQMCD